MVRGRLRDAHGAPVAGTEVLLNHNRVTARLAFGSEERATKTDAAGRFEFAACPAGQHLLRLESLPDGLVPEPGPGNFELAADETRTLELTCAPSI